MYVVSPQGERVWVNKDDIAVRDKANSRPRKPNSEAVTWAQMLKDRNTLFRWGGWSPKTGYDCSGFVQACYESIGIDLPKNSRDQFEFCRDNFQVVAQHLNPDNASTAKSEFAPFANPPSGGKARAGDLVFFHYPVKDKDKKITGYRVGYDGIMMNEQEFIHAEGVRYNKVSINRLACFQDAKENEGSNEAEPYKTTAHYFTIIRPTWVYNEKAKETIPMPSEKRSRFHKLLVQKFKAKKTRDYKKILEGDVKTKPHKQKFLQEITREFETTKKDFDGILESSAPRVNRQYDNLMIIAELSRKAVKEAATPEEKYAARYLYKTTTEKLKGMARQLLSE